jgi:hypothetical protein
MTKPPRSAPLMLAELLGSDFDPTQYKLHCARRNNEGEDPLEIYARGAWDSWVGWNEYRPTKDEFNRARIFSVMQVEPGSNEWIFGGSFDVVGRRPTPRDFGYDVELVRDLTEPLVGRLRLRFWPGTRATRLRFENYLPGIEVIEVTPLPWSGQPFPGIDQINHSFRDLEVVVKANRDDWRRVLDNMKGVYVWNDRATGKGYIGSATSATGALWSRLCNYIESGHGGNKLLLDLVGKRGRDYLRDNFSYALLEYWPTRVDDEHVLDRESYWKDVFGTREHGYNAN